MSGTDATRGENSDEKDHIPLNKRKRGTLEINEQDQTDVLPTNDYERYGLASLMGDNKEKVPVASLVDGSFDTYKTNFKLSHMTTILITNNSSMHVDG